MTDNTALRNLPKVDALLEHPVVADAAKHIARVLAVEAAREAVAAARQSILAGEPAPDRDAIAHDAAARMGAKAAASLVRVINATGIIVHTNLGRSPLAREALDAVESVAAGYSTLEFDIVAGERGSRHAHVEALLCRLTGAEAAMAVNNNAAAVMLGLAGLAGGREAIVSRGQLVEIGGSFRVPDVMAASGARMVEVGTTNKTHLRDYENAIGPETGLLLKVHTSNYQVVGFTQEVALAELVDLGARRGVRVMEDQGSGVLVDLARFGLPHEPTVAESVAAGADLVTFSGDKLLGGPQAGMLVGKAEVIAALKKHPLARAVRLDKMTLAALEATLRLYLDDERALAAIPTLAMLSASLAAVAARAEALASAIREATGGSAEVALADDVSRAGGGALPLADIPTRIVTVVPAGVSVNTLEAALRLGEPHVIARVNEGRLCLDPRTLTDAEVAEVAAAIGRVIKTSR